MSRTKKIAPPKGERDDLQDTAVRASDNSHYTLSHQAFTWSRLVTSIYLAGVALQASVMVALILDVTP